MRKRPLSIAFVACLLMATGILGFAAHAEELVSHGTVQMDILYALVLAVLAVATGIFVWRGRNWARWAAVIWIAFHVAISFFDSWQKVVVHAVLLALFAYCLFRKDANAYLKSPNQANVH